MTSLLVKKFKIYALKSAKITIFSIRLFKFSLVIIDMLMERTVSQILYLGLGLYFM